MNLSVNSLKSVPLGMYCRMSLFMFPIVQSPKPYEFRSKPAWQRLLIMVAGVLFNFLLFALLIYANGNDIIRYFFH